MSSPRRPLIGVLVIALVFALAVPSVALGSVTISQKALGTDQYQFGDSAFVSGANVAFDSVMRPDPMTVGWRLDVWDVAADSSLWNELFAEVDLEDFEGQWVAYRSGGMLEHIYVYNYVTKQQWTISDTIDGMFMHSVRISGNTAVWIDGDPPGSVLKTMNLTTGEVGTEGLLPSADIAFDGNKVVYSRAFMADTNLWVYDLDTNAASAFVFENGPQVMPDIRDGLVVWLDARSGDWTVYSKPVNGGEQKVVATNVSQNTHPRVGDKLVTWTSMTNAEQGQDVWAHDRATGINFPVAAGDGEQVLPSTDGYRIAYTAWSLTSPKIMVADVVVTSAAIAKLKAPKVLQVGAEGKFAIKVSNSDATDAQTIKWDWADGSTSTSDLTGSGRVKMTHAYSAAGSYTVDITVTDASGIIVTKTAQVTVK